MSGPSQLDLPLDDGRTAHVVFTRRRDGDLGDGAADDEARALRRGIAPGPWTCLHQVHGDHVVVVSEPGQHAGADGDAAVVAVPDAAVAVRAADCAPLALVAHRGAVGVVHVGWRGLRDGIVERALEVLRRESGGDAGEVTALLGPCIHPGCYEFSDGDLEPLVARYGAALRRTTVAGAPALDLPAGIEAALAASGVELDRSMSACTACDPRWFSHRARGDTGRHAAVAWITES